MKMHKQKLFLLFISLPLLDRFKFSLLPPILQGIAIPLPGFTPVFSERIGSVNEFLMHLDPNRRGLATGGVA
jgi:hypothetical protein